jgi:hypothetical protein
LQIESAAELPALLLRVRVYRASCVRREPWKPCVGGFVVVFTTVAVLVLAGSSIV